jgi:hypothetical protein
MPSRRRNKLQAKSAVALCQFHANCPLAADGPVPVLSPVFDAHTAG